MASGKTKQTNTVGFATPPATQATTNLQNMVNTPTDFATPIRNSYARAEQNYNRSFNSPLGAYTTADVRDKSKREHGQEMQQQMGLDLSNAAQQSGENQFHRQESVAHLTQPQMYNSGSTQSQGINGLGLTANILGGIF